MIFKLGKIFAALVTFSIMSVAPAMAYYPGYYGPGYPPGWGYPGYGYPGYAVTCFAQNNFGQMFYGVGYNVYQAQSNAMQVCMYTGGYCVVTGCR